MAIRFVRASERIRDRMASAESGSRLQTFCLSSIQLNRGKVILPELKPLRGALLGRLNARIPSKLDGGVDAECLSRRVFQIGTKLRIKQQPAVRPSSIRFA